MPHPFREAADGTNERVCTHSAVPARGGGMPPPYGYNLAKTKKAQRPDGFVRAPVLFLCVGREGRLVRVFFGGLQGSGFVRRNGVFKVAQQV